MSLFSIHVGQEAPTLAYQEQDAYQASSMKCLPVELLVQIISLTISGKNACTLALVCRQWKQIIYKVHPFHLLKRQHFASSVEDFYLYSHAKNKQQVDTINRELEGWLPAFMINCQDERQAAFTLENMWLTPFTTAISSPNQKLAQVLEILRQLKIFDYNPQRHLRHILQATNTLNFSTRLLFSAIQLGYLSLADISQSLRYPSICLAAVQQNGLALPYVPAEFQTPELCLAAVQQNGVALQCVPKELQTPELCLAAVQQHGVALAYVPKELIIPELCLTAVQQNGLALRFVPKELITPELCLAAVQQNGVALRFVLKEFQTPELCLAAVQQNGVALQFVPKKLQKALLSCLSTKELSASIYCAMGQ